MCFFKSKKLQKKFQTFQRKFWKALLICNAIGECFQEDMYLGLGLYVSHFSIEWKLILEGGGEVGSERGEHTMDVQNSIMWAPAESDCLQRLQRQIQSKQKGQHTNIHNKDTFVNPTTNLIRGLIYLCRENSTISIFIK